MNTFTDEILDLHIKCIEEVYQHDYYVDLFEQHLRLSTVDETNLQSICSFWSDFWAMLPDSPSIRRQPFYKICDLAEGSYLMDGFVNICGND